jgi:hypothetical protein
MDVADGATGAHHRIGGRAGTQLGLDPEEDADENGDGYESQEYDYTRGDCTLEVRIDLATNPPTRARTSGADACGPDFAGWSPTLRRVARAYRWPANVASPGA